MKDHLDFPRRDARDAVRVIEAILETPEMSAFLEKTQAVVEELKRECTRLKIGCEADEQTKEMPYSLIWGVEADSASLAVIECALSELTNKQSVFRKRQEGWNALVANPDATSVAVRYKGVDLKKVKDKAADVYHAATAIIAVVDQWPVFDADHKQLAKAAIGALTISIRWIENNPELNPVLMEKAGMFECPPLSSLEGSKSISPAATSLVSAELTQKVKPAKPYDDQSNGFGPRPGRDNPPAGTPVLESHPVADVVIGPWKKKVIQNPDRNDSSTTSAATNISPPERVYGGGKPRLTLVSDPTQPV